MKKIILCFMFSLILMMNGCASLKQWSKERWKSAAPSGDEQKTEEAKQKIN